MDISTVHFKSNFHIRYEEGSPASNGSKANRIIVVEPNINGGENYSVSMLNADGIHPLWGNNVQMTPKQMRIVDRTDELIKLKGYGFDAMGESFGDYGLDIYLKNNEIEKVILFMYDRDVYIEYFKE